ncbi:sulfur carrier protein ThiS [Solitalea lacus]|uniref:sulfur carrier protein ThiS n=1 Tax=Solitalea lacus TaxID=2911172 RepID=UPI001EDBBDDE|nr:sulfur carrier protein ThiS [Solitalea lacus]UKJ06877.1 sulfur carrier protein ThiS [Solitalea lacus]
MEVFVNKTPYQFSEQELKLSFLLSVLNLLEKRGIAVALNNRVIPRSSWSTTLVPESAHITIVTASQGG